MFIAFLVPAFFGLFAVASAQLPPEIMVDKYLIEEDPRAAKRTQSHWSSPVLMEYLRLGSSL